MPIKWNIVFVFLLTYLVSIKVVALQFKDINEYHKQIKFEVQNLCNDKKYQKCLEYCTKEIELAQKESDLIRECIATKLYGSTFYHMGRPKEAKREWIKAIALSEKANVPMVAQNCYSNLGALALEKGDYHLAEKHFLKSLSVADKMGYVGEADYLNTLRLLASLYGETRQLIKADSIFQGLISNPNTKKNLSSYYTAKVFYSRILVENGQWQKGIALSDSCLKEARKSNNFDLHTTVLSIHITNLVNQKKFEEVYVLNKELEQLVNQRNLQVIDKNIADAEVKFNTTQIAYEKKMSLLEAKKERESLIYLSFGIIGLITTSFIFVVQRRKIKSNEHIQREKIIALIEGEEKERTRVAKDLHDGIVQNLTALKMRVQSIPVGKEIGKIDLTNIGSEIDVLSQEIRSIAYQMMPIALKELGLPKALEDVFSRNLVGRGIQFNFEAIGFDLRLTELIEVNLFRIGQELLNNILKHSKSNLVEVLIINRNKRIQFIVEDNGQGMPLGEIHAGIGMNSITTRLTAISGKITFEQRTNGGTIVTIQVPLT